MRRVTGIGGIFFRAKDAPALLAWYKRHLGIDVQDWGGYAFTWTNAEGKPTAGTTVWSISPVEGDLFAPSKATFMINYRVDDLHALVKVLKEEGQTRGRKQRPFRVDPVEVALRHRLKSMRHVLYFPPRRGCSPDFMFCSAAT